MESILEKLCSGQLDPSKYFEPKSIEYCKRDKQVKKIIVKWSEKLDGNEKLEIFDDIFSIYMEMIGIDREEAFQYGFNLAVKLMSEAYSSKLCEANFRSQRD